MSGKNLKERRAPKLFPEMKNMTWR